jgi:uncharacterized coiled-coil DUF342 family protein
MEAPGVLEAWATLFELANNVSRHRPTLWTSPLKRNIKYSKVQADTPWTQAVNISREIESLRSRFNQMRGDITNLERLLKTSREDHARGNNVDMDPTLDELEEQLEDLRRDQDETWNLILALDALFRQCVTAFATLFAALLAA